jgi:hypothetical protein
MLAEFYKEDAPGQVLGRAVWNGSGVELDVDDEHHRESLLRIFRPVPVVIDDPSLRSYGTSGPVQLAPGSLSWFRAAAEARAPDEGLRVRMVPQAHQSMGWEPAGAYRTFNNQIERRELIGVEFVASKPQPEAPPARP